MAPLPNTSLRLLRAFLVVCEEANVGRAASRLYVSQPSLSQDIRRLERDLGCALFIRGPKGMALTSAGEEFARCVRTGLMLIDRGALESRSLADGAQRTIVVGYSPSVGNRLMPALLRTVAQQLPDYRIDEKEVDTGYVTAGVQRGAFDIGIAHHPTPTAGLQSVTIAEEPLCVALSSTHPLAQRDALRLADLAHLDLLIWPRSAAPDYHDHVIGLCRQAELQPRAVREFRRVLTRAYLMAAGHTFSLLPASTMTTRPPGVGFVIPKDDGLHVRLELIRRVDDQRDVLADIENIAVRLGRSLAHVPDITRV